MFETTNQSLSVAINWIYDDICQPWDDAPIKNGDAAEAARVWNHALNIAHQFLNTGCLISIPLLDYCNPQCMKGDPQTNHGTHQGFEHQIISCIDLHDLHHTSIPSHTFLVSTKPLPWLMAHLDEFNMSHMFLVDNMYPLVNKHSY